MNTNLEKIINSHFKLDKYKDDKEYVRRLSEKIDNVEELRKQMENIKKAIRQKIFDGWKQDVRNKFRNKYPDLGPGYPEDYVGVSMKIDEKKTIIRIYEDKKGLFCHVEFDRSLNKSERSVKDTHIMDLTDVLTKKEGYFNGIWEYYGFNDYDEVYSCFLEVVERCLKMMNK